MNPVTVSNEEIELSARAICADLGVSPDAQVFQGPPMRIPSIGECYMVPSTTIPAWHMFYRAASAVLLNVKLREDITGV